MRVDALERAIDEDLAAGMRPMSIVATAGTTSTTSRDPIEQIAAVARAHNVWLHVDAAYAGVAAIMPEFRWVLSGAEHADSIVVNPHKWLFVPMDCSALYVRDLELLRRTFSLVPEYLRTPEESVRNYMDYGLQLGRRFRALKLWFVLRYFGAEELRERLRGHIELAQEFARWVEREPHWEVLAPHPLSVVCFRFAPSSKSEAELEELNARIMESANASGEMFLSHTKIDGRFALRLAIGNLQTTRDDVAAAWEILRECAS
jgi:aromatic-L-amino-acid decarboxylase